MARILALDPSLSGTGYALVVEDSTESGRLETAGRLAPGRKGQSAAARAIDLAMALQAKFVELAPDVIVIETAFERTRGRGARSVRSAMSLPHYGYAVGAALTVAAMAAKAKGTQIITVPAGEWSANMPCGASDTHKRRRVHFAASYYGLSVESFGPVSTAGDVADAVLLARWTVIRRACYPDKLEVVA